MKRVAAKLVLWVRFGTTIMLALPAHAAVVSVAGGFTKLNGHDPYGYLKDVLERLPTQPASRLEELLPPRWASAPTIQSLP